MATAGSDGYIRLFSVKDLSLLATLRGVFGAALCLDVTKDGSMLVAGFEDDTFVVYAGNFGVSSPVY